MKLLFYKYRLIIPLLLLVLSIVSVVIYLVYPVQYFLYITIILGSIGVIVLCLNMLVPGVGLNLPGKNVTSNTSTNEISASFSKKDIQSMKKQVSILVCNIRGFSEINNILKVDKAYEFINEYFQIVEEIVENNQGQFDHLVNDKFNAYFGIEYPDNTYPLKAVKTAVAISDVFDRLKEKWNIDNDKITLSIGINTDIAIVGIVGSKYYKSFNVIGDSVNVAMGIESLNFKYNTKVLVSESTYEKIKNSYNLECIDTLSLTEYAEPIEIFKITF